MMGPSHIFILWVSHKMITLCRPDSGPSWEGSRTCPRTGRGESGTHCNQCRVGFTSSIIDIQKHSMNDIDIQWMSLSTMFTMMGMVYIDGISDGFGIPSEGLPEVRKDSLTGPVFRTWTYCTIPTLSVFVPVQNRMSWGTNSYVGRYIVGIGSERHRYAGLVPFYTM